MSEQRTYPTVAQYLATSIKRAPIPVGALALGLVALGGLLRPYAEPLAWVFGVCAALLLAMLALKAALFPRIVKHDLGNSIFASVAVGAFMAIMQIAALFAPLAPCAMFVLWAAAVLAHAGWIIWFTWAFMRKFDLSQVFPTYFVCYVGIIVASVTSPTFGMEALGRGIWWFGFVASLVLMVVVPLRYAQHAAQQPARPLLCIYTAPMSLSLAGYFAVFEPNAAAVVVMEVLAQAFFVFVLIKLPPMLALPFYPSYAAFTFPFVITASALSKTAALFGGPLWLCVLLGVETAFATAIVLYATVRYLVFLFKPERVAMANDLGNTALPAGTRDAGMRVPSRGVRRALLVAVRVRRLVRRLKGSGR